MTISESLMPVQCSADKAKQSKATISGDINNASVCLDASATDLIDLSSAIMVRFLSTGGEEAWFGISSCGFMLTHC